MPPYTLTAQEKAELKRKYIENVNRANEYLSEENQIKLNLSALDKKLNDPKMQRFYKKGLEIHNNVQEKIRISHNIFNNLPKINGKSYDLDRLIHSEIVASEEPEAMAYNEQKIRDYVNHPDAEAERRYRDLLNLDISDVAKFADSPDAKNFFLDFYEKHQSEIDLANETKVALSHRNPKTPALEQYVKQIGPNFELLANIQDVVNQVKGDEFFTFPDKLTEEQYNELFSDSSYLIDHPEIAEIHKYKITHNMSMEPIEKDFKNFFKVCKEQNIDISNTPLCSIVATDTTTGNQIPFTRYTSIDAWKKEHPDHEENLVRRDSIVDVDLNVDTLQPTILNQQEVDQIKQITTVDHTLEEGYVNPPMPERFKKNVVEEAKEDALYRYALDNKLNLGDIASKGLYGLADSFKGNWKERMFNTTSRQYKNFKENLKIFENPNNASYNRPGPVCDSAKVYLAHKGVTNEEEARRLPSPSKERALLCLNIINTFEEKYGLVRNNEVQNNQNEIQNNQNEVQNNQNEVQNNQNEVQNNNIVREQAIQNPHDLDDDFYDDVSMENDERNLSADNIIEEDKKL